jgi:hypothetical protein
MLAGDGAERSDSPQSGREFGVSREREVLQDRKNPGHGAAS